MLILLISTNLTTKTKNITYILQKTQLLVKIFNVFTSDKVL